MVAEGSEDVRNNMAANFSTEGWMGPESSHQAADIDAELAAVRSLVAAKVKLLAGTDPPNGTVVHGVSLHRELELLVKAGLTPSQALRAGTRNAADAFHLSDRGRIEVGAKADMLLVRGD